MSYRDFKKPKINTGLKISVSNEAITKESTLDYPVFCFKHLDNKFGLDNCDQEDKIALLVRLTKLSQLTWNDIKLSDRHGFGTEKIPTNIIQSERPPFLSDDINHLLAFRFNKLAPFLGHRSGSIFHIVYIDSKFSLYNHGKM